MQASSTRLTVAIPLYRSGPFFETICRNIDAISYVDAEILVSDRHCLDDTLERLAKRYSGDQRVRCIAAHDELDWVGHINALLAIGRGTYWRVLPHDDLSPPGSLELLMAALEAHGELILAYGPTHAIDGNGQHIREKDRLAPHPRQAEGDWTLDLALQMFWRGYFNGAFKGLIRRSAIVDNGLVIRDTRDQVFPERCWLFALCLLGRFHFVPESTYVKRFHEDSVHAGWKISGAHYRSAAEVMCGYVEDLVAERDACSYAQRDLRLNAERMVQWLASTSGPRPAYLAAPSEQAAQIRGLRLGRGRPQHP